MKQRMKKMLCCLIVFSTLILSNTALAADNLTKAAKAASDVTVTSEYDMALQRSAAWKENLSDINALSGEESVDPLEEYKDAFTERCTESAETLKGYGYTSEEIRLMKAYINGEISFEEVAPRAAASISTSLTCSTHTSSQYTGTYNFTWSKFPVDVSEDSITLGALGINNSSSFLTRLDGYLSSISYVDSSGAHVESRTPTFNYSDSGGLTASFPMITTDRSGNKQIWVKSGFVTLTIRPVGSTTFTAARFRGSYLHATKSGVKLSFSLAVSLKPPYFTVTPSISAGSESVTETGVRQTVFYNSGSQDVEFP